jgi:hypothetical protein
MSWIGNLLSAFLGLYVLLDYLDLQDPENRLIFTTVIAFFGLGILMNLLAVPNRMAWLKKLLNDLWKSLILLGYLAYIFKASWLIIDLAIKGIARLLTYGFNWGSLLLLLFAVPFGTYLAIFIPSRFLMKKKDTTEKLPFSPLHFLHPTSGLLTQNKDTTEE